MSIPSYRRNVRRGVTGERTDTCYLAALEQISPYDSLEPSTYRKYQRFIRFWDKTSGQEKRKINPLFKDLISQVAWELGEVEFDEIEFERVETYRQFSNTVRALLRHDFRVAVDIHLDEYGKDSAHPVGLIPLDDDGHFRAVSTWKPCSLYGAVTLRDIYAQIDIHNEPPRILYPFNDTNITALPPTG